MKLNARKCDTATREKDGGKLTDGHGLYLELHKNGSKYWRYKYRCPHTKKEKLLALGVYPEITLSEARERHKEAHKLVSGGIDPQEHKKEKARVRAQEARNTFRILAMEWFEQKKPEWSQKNIDTVLSRLEKDVFPVIGDIPMKQITHQMLLDLANSIKERGASELAKRVVQMSRHIFQYAIITGHVEKNIAADLKGLIKSKPAGHYAALESKEIPDFIKALRSNRANLKRQTYLAVELMMLTFVRTSEMIKAEWSEIDFENQLWIIPGSRMKVKGRDHVVPLSRQALAILKELREIHTHPTYVFPSRTIRKKHMSNNTILMALRRMGYAKEMTGHGFRAMARTAIREKLGYDRDVIEKQLAHKSSGPLGEAYDRTQFIDQRKIMMQGWGDYLDKVANE